MLCHQYSGQRQRPCCFGPSRELHLAPPSRGAIAEPPGSPTSAKLPPTTASTGPHWTSLIRNCRRTRCSVVLHNAPPITLPLPGTLSFRFLMLLGVWGCVYAECSPNSSCMPLCLTMAFMAGYKISMLESPRHGYFTLSLSKLLCLHLLTLDLNFPFFFPHPRSLTHAEYDQVSAHHISPARPASGAGQSLLRWSCLITIVR